MSKREIAVTGAGGMLGKAVVKALQRSEAYDALPYTSVLDITDNWSLRELRGKTIINCAGIVRGRGDVSPKRMGEVNALAPHRLAYVADRLIHVSTDCVFDGSQGPYTESSAPSPVDNYGMSKMIGEVDYGPHLTVRTSFIGMGQRGFLRWILNHPYGANITGYRRWLWNGLYVSTVAQQLVKLVDEPVSGILHMEGPLISKYGLIEKVIKAVRPDLFLVEANSDPRNMVLRSQFYDWHPVNDQATWNEMIEDLKADYEVEQANRMLAQGGDPEVPPGIGI